MKATFFPDQLAFRAWLEANHHKESELLVGFYKVKSGKPSITWSQSVDQALCFGWIDSVRRTIDAESYSIRFTPRKNTQNWSAINIQKVKELVASGLMTDAGLRVFDASHETKEEHYSYEKTSKLAPAYENTFKMNSLAWDFFNKQAPSYQRAIIHWIMQAKQESTQLSRLEKVIGTSAQQKRVTG